MAQEVGHGQTKTLKRGVQAGGVLARYTAIPNQAEG